MSLVFCYRRWLSNALLKGLCLCTLVLFPGCQTFLHSKADTDYRTVQANPNRDTPKAKRLHQKALAILARDESDYLCECVAENRCDPCKAEKHLQDALIADVRFGPAHNTLGTIYLKRRKLYLAAWEFEYASGLMPERGEPLNNLGLVYEEAGRLGQAIENYEEASSRDSTNAVYIGNLAKVSLKQGTPLREVRYLLKELLLYDNRPVWIAWAEELLGTNIDRSATMLTVPESSFMGLEEAMPEEIPAVIEELPMPVLMNPIGEFQE